MPERRLPVRPDLDQLRRQAKELLEAVHHGDADALAEFAEYHPEKIEPASAKLADAQLVLARAYQAASWPRLVHACEMVEAIWGDDLAKVRDLVTQHPALLREDVLVRIDSNWGPPLTYAANLGRDRIIEMLRSLGADDLATALDRAMLQGKVETARKIHAMMGKPPPPADALEGPAYTLNFAGTQFALEIGARVVDEKGKCVAPLATILETDSRKPERRHAILDLYEEYGLELPDTPPMAVIHGRTGKLAAHLRRDPGLLTRQFRFEEFYPPDLGCHGQLLATHGTPLKGATLLHFAIDYDEFDVARWLLDQGMPVDAKAAVDGDGFGGHTALFSTVVAQPNFWMNHNNGPYAAPFTQLLLDRGADPNARASLRKRVHPGYIQNDTLREFRDVTPLEWGAQFHFRKLVSEPAMALIRERGGR